MPSKVQGGVYTFTAPEDFSQEWKIYDGTSDWKFCIGPGSTPLTVNVTNTVKINGSNNFTLPIKKDDILTLTLTGDEDNPSSATLLVTRNIDGDGDSEVSNPWDFCMHAQTADNSEWHDITGSYTISGSGSNAVIKYTFTAILNNDNEFGFKRLEDGSQKEWLACSSSDNIVTASGKSYSSFGNTSNFKFSGNDNSTLTVTFYCTPSNSAPYGIEFSVAGGGGGGGGEGVAQISGTLPVLYITTDDAIIDRNLRDKDYRDGTYYLVDADGTPLIGSEAEPLALEIKARGNYTRTGFSKKPFKIKLGSKQTPLGLTESKHFALLAHADDDLGYLKNYIGFWLGKQIFPQDVFTPQEKPIELVINGDYRGLYFLTESIRVEETLINITEGAKEDESPANASGGYLVEMDNYPADGQIIIGDDKYQNDVWITPDTPEVYSALQEKFVREQFTTMNDLLSAEDAKLWQYLDMDMAARYYVVMEILNHWEAYHGSTYLYRDRGEGQKWMFSPIWDCGNALYAGEKMNWIYEIGRYGHNGHFGNTWIEALRDYPEFTQKAKDTFLWFWGNKVSELEHDIDAYVASISQAAKNDRARWKDAPLPDKYNDPLNNNAETNPTAVYDNSNMAYKRTLAWNNLQAKLKFLKQQWGTPSSSAQEPAWDTTPAAPLPDYAKAPEAKPHNLNTESVYIYVYDKAGWGAVNAYVYKDGSGNNGAWPGVALTKDDSLFYGDYQGLYAYEVPADFVDGLAIFAKSKDDDANRYPADQKPGIEINGKTHLFITGDNSWVEVLPYSVVPVSGNLPVLYISDVADADALANKGETTATMTWDTNGCEDALEITGSVALKKFKGHGSSTWTDWSKKPYKIQANDKVTFFNDGTAESKHWLLLPWCADTELAFLRNVAGHELSRQLGFPWTPQEQPIELVIEGEYQGLYFLVESIRPSENRVDLMDIDDTKKASMPAHWHNWIVEVDQTSADADHAMSISAPTRSYGVNITSDSPELADDMTSAKFQLANSENPEMTNAEQYTADFHADVQAMEDELNSAANNIYSGGWMNIIEPESLARFFVLNELMDDPKAFYTAFYLWKAELDANGAATDENRWQAGPVWDFSAAFESAGAKNAFTHEYEHLAHQIPLTKELWENRWFRNQVVIEFKEFFTGETPVPGAAPRRASLSDDKLNTVESALTSAAAKIDGALEADRTRWAENTDYTGVESATATDKVATVMSYLRSNYSYLNNRLTTEIMTGVEGVEQGAAAPVEYFDTQGRRVLNPERGGIYVVRQGARASLQIVR